MLAPHKLVREEVEAADGSKKKMMKHLDFLSRLLHGVAFMAGGIWCIGSRMRRNTHNP